MAALAVCAVTAALLRRHTGTRVPGWTRPDGYELQPKLQAWGLLTNLGSGSKLDSSTAVRAPT
jgi:hypothetical protein